MTKAELEACLVHLLAAAEECPSEVKFVLIAYHVADDGEANLGMRTNDSPENVIEVLIEVARAAREKMPGAQ
jgi:hypothetical protein